MTNMIREYDHLFKSVIVGNTGVGKSCLLLRFAEGQFYENYLATIGVDFKFKILNVDEKLVKFQIWDTAGQERFRTITSAYYKGSHGVLLVFDLTDKQSFDDIDKFWRAEVESYAEKDVIMYLVGNKADMEDRREVDRQVIDKYA
jgi:Ras-related protein Rab-1A